MDVESPPLAPLERDLRTQVCVIGAGVSGLTTALRLLESGREVVVVDDGPIGGGESARTTAHLTQAMDKRYFLLEDRHGKEATARLARSHTDAIGWIAEQVASEGIECDFARVEGRLFQSDRGRDELEREMESCQRIGLNEVHLSETMPWNTAPSWPSLVFPGQAQFHLGRYLGGLAAKVARLGGTIHTGSRAESVEGDPRPVVKIAGGRTIVADDVVHATHVPLDAPAHLYLSEFPYRSYVIGAPVPRGAVPYALYWDDDDPYHYARLHPREADDLLIVGGEDHPTGKNHDGRERLERVEAWARQHFPEMGEVEYRWSGQLFEPIDGIGIIGPYLNRAHQYVITGSAGNGITYGTLGAALVADLIDGRTNPFAEFYDPRRVPRALQTFVEMVVPAATGYARQWTTGHEDEPTERPGTGKILTVDGKKIAQYRDPSGREYRVRAECTHRGCVVDWNPLEQSWDCRCHGSRFAPNGELLSGPATAPLETVDPD